MKKKILAMLLACSMLAMGMVGCGGKEEAAAPAPAETTEEAAETAEEGPVVAYSCHNLSEAYCGALSDAIKAGVEELGGTYSVTDANNNSTTQINDISDLVAKQIDVLVVTPYDSESLGGVLKEVQEAGIKVICVDSSVCEADLGLVDCVITSDNYTAGVTMAEDLMKRYPDGCTLCYLDVSFIESIHQRFVGLEDTLAGHDQYTIIAKESNGLDKIVNDTEDILQTNSDIQVFCGLNDVVGMSMFATAQAAGLTDAIAYGVDGSPAGKQAIADGEFTVTIAQSPLTLGKEAAKAAVALFNGEEVEFEQKVEMILIDATNVDEYGTEGWQ